MATAKRMTTARANRPARNRPAPARPRTPRQGRPDNRHARYAMEYVDINAVSPYEFNPRDNAAAIASVANSIREVGFIMPIVLDRNNVLVAGHTRIEAAKTLGLPEVPAIRAENLSEEQVAAFRLIDNKVAELAKWDFDLLAGELNKLQSSGINFTDFGWTREELDCLNDVVQDDCLSGESLMDVESRERLRRTERRAPATARFVLGELVFFTSQADYRSWIDSLRTQHDYNEQAMIADVKTRLGIPQA